MNLGGIQNDHLFDFTGTWVSTSRLHRKILQSQLADRKRRLKTNK
jgi:hypothetical protein